MGTIKLSDFCTFFNLFCNFYVLFHYIWNYQLILYVKIDKLMHIPLIGCANSQINAHIPNAHNLDFKTKHLKYLVYYILNKGFIGVHCT